MLVFIWLLEEFYTGFYYCDSVLHYLTSTRQQLLKGLLTIKPVHSELVKYVSEV